MIDAVETLLKDTEDKLSELTFMRKENINTQQKLIEEVDNLSDQVSVLDKVSVLFKHLLDVFLEKKKQDIEKLVTFGLRTVYNDQHLVFHIDMEQKYNGLYTSFRTEKVGVADGDALDSFGGGVVNLESFLLRLITLFQMNLSPFLFLDESFANLSVDYVENCSLLLKELCKKLGVTIILVSHEDLMLTHADKVYRGSLRSNKLITKEEKNERRIKEKI